MRNQFDTDTTSPIVPDQDLAVKMLHIHHDQHITTSNLCVRGVYQLSPSLLHPRSERQNQYPSCHHGGDSPCLSSLFVACWTNEPEHARTMFWLAKLFISCISKLGQRLATLTYADHRCCCRRPLLPKANILRRWGFVPHASAIATSYSMHSELQTVVWRSRCDIAGICWNLSTFCLTTSHNITQSYYRLRLEASKY